MVALPAVITGFGGGGALGGEVEAAEEERGFGEFAHRFGVAAELVAEDFGVGAGRGDVRSRDDLLLRAVDHAGEGGAAGVVKAAFPGQGFVER
ncbi:hypothetical protein GCM10010277_51610 [Streptomyces longisporoflavus]|nr:hypothetical protein GCM10010277_51610 [Streptomyces longisporoflavus]